MLFMIIVTSLLLKNDKNVNIIEKHKQNLIYDILTMNFDSEIDNIKTFTPVTLKNINLTYAIRNKNKNGEQIHYTILNNGIFRKDEFVEELTFNKLVFTRHKHIENIGELFGFLMIFWGCTYRHKIIGYCNDEVYDLTYHINKLSKNDRLKLLPDKIIDALEQNAMYTDWRTTRESDY